MADDDHKRPVTNSVRVAEGNPPENVLGPNAEAEQVIEGLKASGYPLEGVVCRAMIDHFDMVVPEWGFVDSETNKHRSLDVFGSKEVARSEAVEATVVLLVECKRSDLPYVFFRDVTPTTTVRGFPRSCGLQRSVVRVHERHGNRSVEWPVAAAFDLTAHPFITAVPVCSAFARAEPKTKKAFRFSGADTFRRVVLPLARATDHAAAMFQPHRNAVPIRPKAVVSVAVLDAPMLLVEDPERPGDPVMTPWVRVRRQEARSQERSYDMYAWYGIDVVHTAFFETYLESHLLPYASDFGNALVTNSDIVLHGGEVEDIKDFEWASVTRRVDPPT